MATHPVNSTRAWVEYLLRQGGLGVALSLMLWLVWSTQKAVIAKLETIQQNTERMLYHLERLNDAGR
jgi:hypothetical protein